MDFTGNRGKNLRSGEDAKVEFSSMEVDEYIDAE